MSEQRLIAGIFRLLVTSFYSIARVRFLEQSVPAWQLEVSIWDPVQVQTSSSGNLGSLRI